MGKSPTKQRLRLSDAPLQLNACLLLLLQRRLLHFGLRLLQVPPVLLGCWM